MFRRSRGIEVKRPEQIVAMRRAGLVVARALDAVLAELRPGVTAAELDGVAADVIRSAGATPSFLGYGAVGGVGGFPAVTCISVNEEVVHGIPGRRTIAEGDLVSVDCGAIVDGWHGDAARTVLVPGGAGDAARIEVRRLNEATRQAMWRGIASARVGGRVGDISSAVQSAIREFAPSRASIVTDYVGHGIGSAMHQPPDVPNVASGSRGPRLVEGMALAIEPMVILGPADTVELPDGWTVVSADGSVATHWEHTVALTARGLWVLTAGDGGEEMLEALDAPYGPLA